MNDEHYLNYCTDLLSEFACDLVQRTESLGEEDRLKTLARAYSDLSKSKESVYAQGNELTQTLFNNFPDMAPLLPRQLLWFFGGDCLHFMSDDEISQFQQLDEEREQAAALGNVYDLTEARAKLLNLQ
jgi:hypothetical protein